jgi:hypothetical protein
LELRILNSACPKPVAADVRRRNRLHFTAKIRLLTSAATGFRAAWGQSPKGFTPKAHHHAEKRCLQFAALALGFCHLALYSQEALRMSLASAQAAEARRKARATTGYYNLQMGPTYWNFSSALSVEYNDNVNYSDVHKESDVIFTPQVNSHAIWPVSDKNSFNLDVGAGYQAYVDHPNLNRIIITPGSELSFDLYAGDFWINFHDRFSLQDASADPTVANVNNASDYSYFQNDVGLTTTWDLNKVLVRLGYDHQNSFALSGTGAENSSDLFFSSVGYALRPLTQAGIELSGGLSEFGNVPNSGTNQNNSIDSTHWSAGAFYDTQLNQYIHVHASAGYIAYISESGGTNLPDFDGYYLQVALDHHLTQFMSYSLTAGRSISFGFSGGAIDLYSVNLQANWNIIRATTLSSSFIFEDGTQLSNGFEHPENFTRYGANIVLGCTLTRKLSATLGYQFYYRLSDQANRDYTVNIFRLSLAYKF